jgi:DnaJ-class molecular chaperone
MEYYVVLGVEKSATHVQIIKAYRKQVLSSHPDKAPPGCESEYAKKFQLLTDAYEVLSDPAKRAKYDMYGLDGLIPPTHTQADHMRDFMARSGFSGGFGGGFGFGGFGFPGFGGSGMREIRKSGDICYNLVLTLKDAYLGISKHLKVNRNVIMGPTGPVLTNIDQTWMNCSKCSSQGRIGMGGCGGCNFGVALKPGFRVESLPVLLSINVGRGSKSGDNLRFTNQGDCGAGLIPGDVVVTVVIPDKHGPFTRVGNDLVISYSIKLIDMICGFTVSIVTIDDRTISFDVVDLKPSECKIIEGEGIGGNLIVNFNVEMPVLDDAGKEALKALIG